MMVSLFFLFFAMGLLIVTEQKASYFKPLMFFSLIIITYWNAHHMTDALNLNWM